jgi:glycerol uptake facilitator-like aquaporin
MSAYSRQQRLVAEGLGTALLLATVVGSGIMAERLSGGNGAIDLLGNTIPTGAILIVLITMFGPISGAHFNPAVTVVSALRNELLDSDVLPYIAAQVAGAIVGVWIAHLMFDESMLQISTKARTGPSQWLSECVAAFGLVLAIILTARVNPSNVAAVVGLYITAAYWFTASTSFANPAVTVARSLSNTFAGIRPADVVPFVIAQMIGAIAAMYASRWLACAGGPPRT